VAVLVDDIVKCSGLSRSVLQRRFRSVLGTTIHHEILSACLKEACHLLVEIDLTMIDIAERVGFRHQEHMGVVFRKRLKTTPGR
tara:strand:+ start:67 stop:318 length:252 start_codon:yes stop_codon:yes gene_type:complete